MFEKFKARRMYKEKLAYALYEIETELKPRINAIEKCLIDKGIMTIYEKGNVSTVFPVYFKEDSQVNPEELRKCTK